MDPFTVIQFGGPPSVGERLLGFVLGVLVCGFALFVSRYLADVNGYDHAVLTAVTGALVWSLLPPIPLFGPVIALIGWIAILK